jgi:putative sugar O-methyltransferase
LIQSQLIQLKQNIRSLSRHFAGYTRLHPAGYTREKFHAVVEQARGYYRTVQTTEEFALNQGWIHPDWQTNQQKIRNYLLGSIQEDFLHFPPILGAMVITGWRDMQYYHLAHVQSGSEAFKRFVKGFKESRVGKPYLECTQLGVSSSTLAALYYLVRLESIWGVFANPPTVITELGGGYGNFARIITEALPGTTLVIIDLPELLGIQHLFLHLNLPASKINAINHQNLAIQPNKINLLPLGMVEKVPLKTDLFYSTHALTETTPSLLDYVVTQRNYFEANRIFLAASLAATFMESQEMLTKVRSNLSHCVLHEWYTPELFEIIGWNTQTPLSGTIPSLNGVQYAE